MFKEILLDENIDLYRSLYNEAAFKTIYHHPDYLLAEEMAETYHTYLYLYEQGGEFVALPSIKRRINDIDVFVDEGEEYFDLMTPHEYSGVLASRYDLDLFRKFYIELKRYCISNNIIFQFIRFNPYSDEHKAAENFDIKLVDAQNWVDCSGDVLQHFQKRKARYVKSAMKSGMKCEEMEKSQNNIDIFYQYYKKAMNRLQAKHFLYFNDKYFFNLYKCEFTKLFFVIDSQTEQILTGIIVLCDEYHKKLYHHLSFRNDQAGNIHSMEYMIFATSQWAKKYGYTSMHLGGGSDSLHRFKDECTDKRVDFYCGSIVYCPELYQLLSDKYCEKYVEERNSSYLPIYRSKE